MATKKNSKVNWSKETLKTTDEEKKAWQYKGKNKEVVDHDANKAFDEWEKYIKSSQFQKDVKEQEEYEEYQKKYWQYQSEKRKADAKVKQSGATDYEDYYQQQKEQNNKARKTLNWETFKKWLNTKQASATGYETDELSSYYAKQAETPTVDSSSYDAALKAKQESDEALSYASQWRHTAAYEDKDFNTKSAKGLETAAADLEAYNSKYDTGRTEYDYVMLPTDSEVRRIYGKDVSAYMPTEQWTDDEKALFGYYYSTDKDKAIELGSSINRQLENASDKAEQEAIAQRYQNASTIGKIGYGALSVAEGVTPIGLTDFAQNAMGSIVNGDNWVGLEGLTTTQMVNGIDNAITEDLNTKYGTIDSKLPVIGEKGWGDAYQLGKSIIDSMITAGMSSSVTAAATAKGFSEKAAEWAGKGITYSIFFGNAAAQGYDDAMQRGATPGQAVFLGLADGTAEALFEEVSIEQLIKAGSSSTIKELVVNVLKQNVTEGSEELFTSIANLVSDAVIMQGNSEFQQKIDELVEQGYSYEDAYKASLKDTIEGLAYDALGGAISGGVSGSIYGGTGLAYSNGTLTQGDLTGTKDRTKVSAQSVYDMSNEFAGENTAATIAQVQEENKNRTGKKANTLTRNQYSRIRETWDEDAYTAKINEEKAQREEAKAKVMQAASANAEAVEEVNQLVSEGARREAESKPVMAGQSLDVGGQTVTAAAENTFSMKDGNLTLNATNASGEQTQLDLSNTENFETLPADTQAAIEYARTLFGSQAHLVLNAYDGKMSIETYMTAMDKAANMYEANGMDVEQASKTSLTRALSVQQIETAKHVGTIANEARTQNIANNAAKLSEARAALEEQQAEGKAAVKSYTNAIRLTRNMMKAEQSEIARIDRQLKTLDENSEQHKKLQARKAQLEKEYANNKRSVEQMGDEAERIKSADRIAGSVSLDGGVIKDNKGNTIELKAVDRSKMTDKQKRMVGFVAKLNSIFDLDFVMFDGDAKGAQGAYTGGGTIYVNINAGMAAGKTWIAQTIGHELTHYMQRYAPTEYEELKQYIQAKYLELDAQGFEALVHDKMQKGGLSESAAIDEIVANTCEELLYDSKAIKQLAIENMSLAERIRDFLKNMRQELDEAFSEKDELRYEAIFARQFKDELKELQDKWDKGIYEAVMNRRAERANARRHTTERTMTEEDYEDVTKAGIDAATMPDELTEEYMEEVADAAARADALNEQLQEIKGSSQFQTWYENVREDDREITALDRAYENNDHAYIDAQVKKGRLHPDVAERLKDVAQLRHDVFEFLDTIPEYQLYKNEPDYMWEDEFAGLFDFDFDPYSSVHTNGDSVAQFLNGLIEDEYKANGSKRFRMQGFKLLERLVENMEADIADRWADPGTDMNWNADFTEWYEARHPIEETPMENYRYGSYEEAEEVGDSDTQFSLWEGEEPKKTQWGFKLMTVDADGKPHAMFIDNASAFEYGVWYKADSPMLKDLEKLEAGYSYLIDNETGEALDSKPYNVSVDGKGKENITGLPGKRQINAATNNGQRWIMVHKFKSTKDGHKAGDKAYYNVGINGSGSVSRFALRPGLHAVDLPSMRHIGAKVGKAVTYRRPNQRWFLIEYPVDVDYNAEAFANDTKDIVSHLPTDGWYSFQTNSGAEKKQHWFITGGMRIVGAVSEEDAIKFTKKFGGKIKQDLPYKDGIKDFDESDSIDLMKWAEEHADTQTPSKADMLKRITNGTQFQSWEERDAEYMKAVESGDKKTMQRMVDEAAEESLKNSKLRTPDGKLRKVFHGTNTGNFTVFDKATIGSSSGDNGFFGEGFYFAYTAGEAAMYGGRIISAYLDLRNPYNFVEELHTYNGMKTYDYYAGRAVFAINFSEKFPELAKSRTALTFDKDGNGIEIPFAQIAEEYKDVIKNVKFNILEFDDGYGTKDFKVVAGKHKVTKVIEGEKYSWDEYDFEERVYDRKTAEDTLRNAYSYLVKVKYGGDLSLSNSTMDIMETDFTDALKKRGYDGVIQSEDGDEAVAFEPEQIKSAAPVTYDDEGNVIPLSQRFDTAKDDIRWQTWDDTELEEMADKQEPMNEAQELQYSTWADTDFMDKDVNKLTKNKKFKASVIGQRGQKAYDQLLEDMEGARSAREAVKALLRDPALVDRLRLPPDVMGNTLISNSSYGGTEENRPVCIRSLGAQALLDLVSDYFNRPLTVNETLQISEEIMATANKPECIYCYVAQDRRAYREYLGEYVKQRNAAIKDLKDGMEYETAYRDYLNGRADTDNTAHRFTIFQRILDGEIKPIAEKDLANLDRLLSEASSLKADLIDYAAERYGRAATRIAIVSNGGTQTIKTIPKGKEESKVLTTVDELLTDETIKDKAGRYIQLADAMAYAQSASWAKKMTPYAAYNGHILNMRQARVDFFNDHYGLRMYSFSDFSPAFILENMQMITDASVVGLKVLAYTKELDFVKIFADTGANINISVFAAHAKMDDRSSEIIPDAMMGADWNEAIALREKYPNVGLTLVATDDDIIEWARTSEYGKHIDVIIPFHIVRTGEETAQFFNYINFTKETEDKGLLESSWYEDNKIPKTVYPNEHNNNFRSYMEKIDERHLTPRFARYINGYEQYLDNEITLDELVELNKDGFYMKFVNETRRSAEDTPPVRAYWTEDNLKVAEDAIRQMAADGGYGAYGPYAIGGKTEKGQQRNTERIIRKLEHNGSERVPESGTLQLQTWEDGTKKSKGVQIDEQEALTRLKSENFQLEELVKQLTKERDKAVKEAKESGRQLKLTRTNEVRRSDSDKLTNRLIRELGYTGDTEEKQQLRDAMKDLGDYIVNATGETVDYDVLKAKARAIAGELVSNANMFIDEDRTEETDARDRMDALHKELTGRTYRLPAADVGEIEQAFGSMKNFREKYFGRFFVSETKGEAIDTLYGQLRSNQLGDNWSDYLPEADSLGEMLLNIAAAVDKTERVYANPFRGNIEESAEAYANDIIFDMISDEVRQALPTFADIKEGQIGEAKAKGAEKARKAYELGAARLNALRAEKNARIAEVRQQGAAEKKAAVAKEKAEKWKAVAKERDYWRTREAEARAQRNESAAIKRYIKSINKDVKDLIDWSVKPSTKDIRKHVPAEIQSAVRDFVLSIDQSSKRLLGGGAETGNDRAMAKAMEKMRRVLDSKVNTGEIYSGRYDLPANFIEEFGKLTSAVNIITASGQGGYVLNSMSAAELKILRDSLKALKKLITDMNVLHNNQMFAHAYEAGENSTSFIEKLGKAKQHVAEFAYKFMGFDNMRPVYVFDRFGEGGQSVFQEFVEGQDELAKLTDEIIAFRDKTYTAEQANEWANEMHEFEVNGEKITMSTAQLMSLYCLNRREQGKTHIFGEGFRVANTKVQTKGKYGIKRSYTYRDEGHNITQLDVGEMLETLTEDQKKVAEAMQKFMSTTCSGWGNYVTRIRFDVDGFTEPYYFPINSDGRILPANADEMPSNASLYALLNAGFTKELKENANNRIILYNIFDVFANHTASMAQYRSFALPVLDALKWFNYSNEETSLRDEMAKAFGSPEEKTGSGTKGYAESFVINFLKAVNGTAAQGDVYDNMGLKFLHAYNRAAIAFNGRVVIQQPMAITRAAMFLKKSDLTDGMRRSATDKWALANEMEMYSGMAKWKALGFYDTNVSRGLTDMISYREDFGEKVTEIGTKGAELADRLTWGAIWYAAKQSVSRSDYGTEEEYFEAVTKVFENVIIRSQVVDSIVTKSEFMRAKGFLARTFGSFMGEPTTTISMLSDAGFRYEYDIQSGMTGRDAFKKNSAYIKATIANYVVSQILLAVVQSLYDAWRDDDDYATWLEKYLEALKGNAADELNPLSKIPVVKDILEVAKEVARALGADTYGNVNSGILGEISEYTIKIAEMVGEMQSEDGSNYTGWALLYKCLQLGASITGLPMATTFREAKDLWNNTAGKWMGMPIKMYDGGDKNNIKWAYQDGYLTEDEAAEELIEKGEAETREEALKLTYGWGTDGSSYKPLKDEILNGTEAGFEAVKNEMLEHGYDEEAINKTVKSYIKELYTDSSQSFGKTDAVNALRDYAGYDSQTANDTVSYWWIMKEYGSEVDADGNGSVKMDELGTFLNQLIRSGEIDSTEAQSIWNGCNPSWKTTYSEWKKK